MDKVVNEYSKYAAKCVMRINTILDTFNIIGNSTIPGFYLIPVNVIVMQKMCHLVKMIGQSKSFISKERKSLKPSIFLQSEAGGAL